jgi:D-alanyl-D-alanine carboxypeptidase
VAVDQELQELYAEAVRRGMFKKDPELQEIGHELRARGIVSDPTQGGLVTLKVPKGINVGPNADLSALHPDAVPALQNALNEAVKLGIPVTVTSAARSYGKQAQLYANRASNPNPVAPPGTSRHESGRAVDLDTTDEYRPFLTAVLEKHGFQWGGHFRKPDPVHYQFVGKPIPPKPMQPETTATDKPAPTRKPTVEAQPPRAGVSRPQSTTASMSPAPRMTPLPQGPTIGAAPNTAGTLAGALRAIPQHGLPALQAAGAAGRDLLMDVLATPFRALDTAGAQLGTEIHQNPGLLNIFSGSAVNTDRGFLRDLSLLLHGHGMDRTPIDPDVLHRSEAAARVLGAGARAAVSPREGRPPALVTNATGVQPGSPGYIPARVTDYALSFANPGPAIAGKTVGRLSEALGRGAVTARDAALASGPGQKLVAAAERAGNTRYGLQAKRLAGGLGIGPNARLVRAVDARLRPQLEERIGRINKIAEDMQATVERLRPETPTGPVPPNAHADFEQGLQSYRAWRKQQLATTAGKAHHTIEDLGPTPLHEVVRHWVVKMRFDDLGNPVGHLPPDGQYIRAIVALYHVPMRDVVRFGQRYIREIQQTREDLAGTGAKLGGWEKFANDFIVQSFGRGAARTTTEVGAQAIAGTGVQAARQAALRNVWVGVKDDPTFSRPIGAGGVLPGWRRVDAKTPFTTLTGANVRQVPEPVYWLLNNEAALASRQAHEVLEGVGLPTSRAQQTIHRGVEWLARATGIQKKIWIANPATLAGNAGSNYAVSELALQKEVGSAAGLGPDLVRAVREMRERKTYGLSSDMEELGDVFSHTQASTSALAPARSAKEVAGAAGRVVKEPQVFQRPLNPALPPGPSNPLVQVVGEKGRIVHDPTPLEFAMEPIDKLAAAHGLTEQTFKLALYKSFKRAGKTPDEAKKLVQKYLFDYSDRPFLLEAADRYGIWIFNAFPTKATKLFLETVATRPDLVARYPRLAQLSRQEFGAEQNYENSPGYRHGPLVFATGPNSFIDLGRFWQFTGPMEAMENYVGRPLQGRAPELPTGPDLLSHTVASPWLAQVPNMQLYSDPDNPAHIAEPGSPLEAQYGDRAQELIRDLTPGFVRGTSRVWDSALGKSPTDAMTGEPQSVPAAMAQAYLGIPSFTGGSLADRKARLGPSIDRRAAVADRYAAALERELNAGRLKNKYAGGINKRTDIDGLKRELRLVDQRYHQVLLSPRSVVNGKLTAEGRNKITQSFLLRVALANRIDALAQ